MSFASIADVLAGKHTGASVRLRGWVHRQRSGGKIAFVTLRDGSGAVQCTVKLGIADDESLAAAKEALIESSVSLLEGDVVEDERAPGGYEVKVTKFVLHQKAEDFPLRGDQGTEFELDNRHLWLRSSQLSAILRIKSRLLHAIREFYAAEGFTEVDPSVITTNACEGGSTLFTFDYFGKEAYLSQSAQMYLEGCIFGTPKVFSITNSFRAEKSRTNKHLTEFHHLEAEYAWEDSDANMAFQERMVAYLAHDIADHCEADLRLLEQDPDRLRKVVAPFPRITYDAAVEQLQAMGYEFNKGDDFGAPHEKALTEGMAVPMFIYDWPAEIKAFYMHQDPENPDYVKCSDLLGPDGFGEIIGGSQRSEDIEWMQNRLIAQLGREIIEEPKWIDPIYHDENEIHVHPDDWEFDENQPDPKLGAKIVSKLAEGKTWNESIEGASEESVWAALLIISQHQSYGKWCNLVTGFEDDTQSFRFNGLSFLDPNTKLYARHASRMNALEDWWEALVKDYLAPYEWYFDLRRYGSVPHSGFGLDIERLLRWFTGQEHIRDMLPYPRTPSRAYP
ncbi:MAG: asparagine--tRNA ligase [Thermoplasmatota archaeon]